ncbi:flagellar hook-basal body protein [uncultured Sphingomonas sp.]|uniref:flagellar hook-basal body protein n=1 Tax=uncultured Sphingomonas sp. TaxID=158754 RepID=UPI0035CB9A50
MNGAFYVGAVGLQAQERALSVISNNIANINTPAFKRSDIRFSSVLATRADADVPSASIDSGFSAAGVMASATPAMDVDGELQATGKPMDLAIRGRGFIELMAPGGQTLLWRGGALKVDDEGMLTAAGSGLPLKAAISVPADTISITVAGDGKVSAVNASDAAPVEIGQIDLVTADDMGGFEALDGGLYRVADDARLRSNTAGEDGAGMLVQGSVERSNVEMTTEMVSLMLVQRAYAANAQIVQAADQLMAIANGLRR